jgi:hypothetical protein
MDVRQLGMAMQLLGCSRLVLLQRLLVRLQEQLV